MADSLAGTLARTVAERASRRGTLPFKGRLEQSFGESLGDVSVRTGVQAELAPFGALAATRGNSIVFAETTPPLDTVAHEIAHVIQNRHATSAPPAAVGPESGPAELEAGAAARAVVAGGTASVSAAPGGAIQCFLGIGAKKKKKKPPRPTQALPAPARPKQDLPAPARPKQDLPAPARPKQDLPSPARPKQALPPVAGAVVQAAAPFQERQFDMGSDDMDLFQARQFDLGPAAAAFKPPQVDMAPQPPAHVALSDDDGFAPELVPDETGLVPVTGNPYLEQLVARLAPYKAARTHLPFGYLYSLQQMGGPPPRPIDPNKAAVTTGPDGGYLGPAAPAFKPPQVDMAAQPPAHVALSGDDGFAPELVPDETGLVPVTGNPYLEELVARLAPYKTGRTHLPYGYLYGLQGMGGPPTRPIERNKAAVTTAPDGGYLS